MQFEIKYKLEFYSPWHCGSGMGGHDDSDFVPILDKDGIPFVPGKTIKGLFREASAFLHGDDFTKHVFGSASVKGNLLSSEGSAIWSNAELSNSLKAKVISEGLSDVLLESRYFIKIQNDGSLQTEKKSLRRGEYVIPLTLYGTISHVDENDLNKLKDCMGYIKQMGLQRNRGFGRCSFTMVGQPKPIENTKAGIIQKQNEYCFLCKLLSPIILNTTGATENNIDTLEYIPGSNFLGIAAKDYESFGEYAFDIFHSGKVRFGNAYPSDGNGLKSLPIPANWFVPKGKSLKDGVIYTTPEQCREVQAKEQPKQVRSGFFFPDDTVIGFNGEISKSFSLKSAYDSEKRKSKDSQMFGYTALISGTDWIFSLKVDDSIPLDIIQKLIGSLIGRKQIGRSKTSQYGSVEISLISCSESKKSSKQSSFDNLHYIYAASCLAFIDDFGEPTLLPTISDLGFDKNAYIDMEHSKVLYREYCQWNGIRKSRDSIRLVISPGSVFAVKSDTPPNLNTINAGVGIYKSEGFGEVLYNPEFLHCKQIQWKKTSIVSSASTIEEKEDKHIIELLKARRKAKDDILQIYSRIDNILANSQIYQRITSSQWGAVRAIAVSQTSYNDMMDALFKEESERKPITYIDQIKNNKVSHQNDPGFLCHGKKSGLWKNCRDNFKNEIESVKKDLGEDNAIIFVELLSSEMSKRANAKGGR